MSSDCKGNSKKFWAYVKSKGQEFTGVAPLKNQDGFLQSDNKARANILNEQFKSVFTREDNSSIPDTGDSDIPSMPDIKVDWKISKSFEKTTFRCEIVIFIPSHN